MRQENGEGLRGKVALEGGVEEFIDNERGYHVQTVMSPSHICARRNDLSGLNMILRAGGDVNTIATELVNLKNGAWTEDGQSDPREEVRPSGQARGGGAH